VTEEQDEDGDDPYGLYGEGNGSSGDKLYDQALQIVARERKATTSYIQRRLEIGYNRAARLIERMEEEGVISRPNHQVRCEVLLPEGREYPRERSRLWSGLTRREPIRHNCNQRL
jgi:S-DNA-T family DNA segregation ATPase FtsK/SpoIIIE